MLTHTITLRDVYGVDTPEEAWERYLPYAEHKAIVGKYEMTGEFRSPADDEYSIGSDWILSKGRCWLSGPRLILRRRCVKRWRLAPGEQPRKLVDGDVAAGVDTYAENTICQGVGYRGLYGFVLEQYEEEA